MTKLSVLKILSCYVSCHNGAKIKALCKRGESLLVRDINLGGLGSLLLMLTTALVELDLDSGLLLLGGLLGSLLSLLGLGSLLGLLGSDGLLLLSGKIDASERSKVLLVNRALDLDGGGRAEDGLHTLLLLAVLINSTLLLTELLSSLLLLSEFTLFVLLFLLLVLLLLNVVGGLAPVALASALLLGALMSTASAVVTIELTLGGTLASASVVALDGKLARALAGAAALLLNSRVRDLAAADLLGSLHTLRVLGGDGSLLRSLLLYLLLLLGVVDLRVGGLSREESKSVGSRHCDRCRKKKSPQKQ